MQRAEANLDKFWAEADREILDHQKQMELPFDATRVRYRTPDWVEPQSRRESRAPQVPQVSQDVINFELALRTQQRPNKSQPGNKQPEKAKTRGPAQAPSSEFPVAPPEDGTPIPKISVTHKSLQVFQMLLPHRWDGALPGQLPRKDFVFAMNEAGFQTEPIPGSSVGFIHKETRQRIQVHRPHPHPKYEFLVARNIGKRLRDRFGWDEETFCLRSM
ncbi:hypothetical protein N7523_005530 [Penicillium sp. IBT 18751x]|nr:hypothetical protein N7523_005884 [Penicillium sp. IBT 18751x]KAJ6117779.1 hypothetical protein N7523_005530 [Penicillium sp. IBT 18751x]